MYHFEGHWQHPWNDKNLLLEDARIKKGVGVANNQYDR